MNIETTNLKKVEQVQQAKTSKINKDSDAKFANELKELKELKEVEVNNEVKEELSAEKPVIDVEKLDESKIFTEVKNPFKKVLVGEKVETIVSKDLLEEKKVSDSLEQVVLDAKPIDGKDVLNLDNTLLELNSVVKEIKSENKGIAGNVQEENFMEAKKQNLSAHLSKQSDVENFMNTVINQTEEKELVSLEKEENKDDKKENDMINNDFSIQENKDIMPQAGAGMNFAGNGQPFSSFMSNDDNKNDSNKVLESTIAELEEESKILSTMEENIAIANKSNILKSKEANKEKNDGKIDATTELAIKNIVAPNIDVNSLEKNLDSVIKEVKQTQKPVVQKNEDNTMLENLAESIDNVEEDEIQLQHKTVTREDGIKKVDTKTGVTVENIVKFDNIIMNQADVEIFATLVENGEVNLNNLAPQASQRALQASKTLADMLAKSMENNQPLRIDFDNDISIIIKVSRDGKISAEFLPSSQIAEAYLKENLPLLKQRFDNNNIDYEELSQRNHKDRGEKENNRKKGRNNE